MGNMGYCRFQNTLPDLRDCEEYMYDEVSEEEEKARQRLFKLVREMASAIEEDELIK